MRRPDTDKNIPSKCEAAMHKLSQWDKRSKKAHTKRRDAQLRKETHQKEGCATKK